MTPQQDGHQSSREEVNELLVRVNRMVFGEGSRLKLRYVGIDEAREQDINANVMPQGMFNALIGNVQKNAALESVPLLASRAETPQVLEVVSGHHRTRAARQAGLKGYMALVYEGITSSEIRAKQLAHNAIQGKSDPEIVREIFAQIESLPEQMEAYVDPAAFAALPEPVKFTMVDIDPLAESKTVTVVFLPTQARDFKTALEWVCDEPDEVYVAHREAFDAFKQAVQEARRDLEIVAMPSAVATIARLALERLAELRAAREAGEAPSIVTVGIDDELRAALGKDESA